MLADMMTGKDLEGMGSVLLAVLSLHFFFLEREWGIPRRVSSQDNRQSYVTREVTFKPSKLYIANWLVLGVKLSARKWSVLKVVQYLPVKVGRPRPIRHWRHLVTGFSRFPCAYKQMLRWFSTFQVATTCFSCSPPDLNLVVTNFMFCLHVK